MALSICDIPGHDLLHSIDEKLDGIAENQQSLVDEVFGRENKLGLSAKVDALTSGNKKESLITSFVTSVIVAVAAVFGINVSN